MDEGEALGYLRRFRSPKTERLAREAHFKKLLAKCKLTRVCPHCGDPNGQIKCVLPCQARTTGTEYKCLYHLCVTQLRSAIAGVHPNTSCCASTPRTVSRVFRVVLNPSSGRCAVACSRATHGVGLRAPCSCKRTGFDAAA